jgi:hypothetical protein
MIFDDCLMIITPRFLFHEYCLPRRRSFTTNLSLQALFIVNSFSVHISLFVVSYLARPSHRPPFSSQLGLQLDLLSCSSVSVRGTKRFLTRCYSALIHCVALHHHVLILSE